MNVLQILPELNVGGVETGTVDFAKYLVEHGHKSVVISNGGFLVTRLQEQGTTHYKLPVHQKNLLTAFFMVKKVRQIIAREKIDIVHARSRVPGWIAYWACRKTKASFITTCHGYYKSKLYSRVMGWAKLVIVPSKVIGRHMIDDFKVPADHVRCIPRSVDLTRFPPKEQVEKGRSSQTVAIIGRITALKGHTYFLRAMVKIVRNFPYARIWIIGDAPSGKQEYKQELVTLTKRLGLQNHVEFLGNRQDVPELLKEIDVLVFSSVEPESFGRVIVEAQAVGVPVVASSVGGVVDIIDDEQTGLLVPPRDAEAIAKAVIRLLNDRALVEKFNAAARQKIRENFTLEKMAERTIALYDELLARQNILVIKFGSVGDVVLITASLRAIRRKFPEAVIHCLIGKDSWKVLQGCPFVDDLIVYDRNGNDEGILAFLNLALRLRGYRFDKVIDFQNNTKSHWLAYFSGAKETYGYCNKKFGFLLTDGIADSEKFIPAVAHQFRVLERLGIVYRENTYLQLWPSHDDKAHAQELLDSEWLGSTKNIVGINLAASARWTSKNWPLKSIAELSDKLAQKNIRVILTGTEKDREAAREVRLMSDSKPASFTGKTDVLQLAALIARCRVFVSPDSAPVHIAAAMNVPIVALFGPTDPARHVPPAKNLVVVHKSLECVPCYNPQCYAGTPQCMTAISSDEIFEKVMQFMEEPL